MPLSQSPTDAARASNANKEMQAGKARKVAWAIAYSVQKANGGKDAK